jgi:hypothetical protein
MIITQLLLLGILLVLIFNGLNAISLSYSGPSEEQVSAHISRLESQLTKINNELSTIRDDIKSLKPRTSDYLDSD